MGPRKLGTAAAAGDLSLVKQFLRDGSDPNERVPSTGHFPLCGAAHYGHVRVVRHLLKHGARINTRTQCGGTALFSAAYRGHLPVVRALLEAGAQPNLGIYHCDFGPWSNRKGYTALHMAAEYGYVRILNELVDGGANTNARDSLKWTPVDAAIKSKKYRAACYLLSRGGKSRSTWNFGG